MPVPKKKRITPENVVSTSESSSPPLPDQQEFHQHLRILAQSAVRTVIEFVMREELDAVIGAAWGECTPKRKGYRNGYYKRDLITSSGRIEDMNVPGIVKGSSIPRRSSATAALNLILQKD